MNGVRAEDSDEGRGGMRRMKGNGSPRGSYRAHKEGGERRASRGMDGSVYADWFLLGCSRATLIGRESKKRCWGRVNEADERHRVL